MTVAVSGLDSGIAHDGETAVATLASSFESGEAMRDIGG